MGFKPVYGLCPACGWVRACRADGTLREHKHVDDTGRYTGDSCPGIGQKPDKYVPRPTVATVVDRARRG